jgi:phosphate/sulfate permease
MLLLATLAGFAQGPKLIALAQALSLSASPGLALIAGVCAFGGIRVAARLGSAWTAPADQPTAHAGLLAIGLTTVGLLGGWPLSLTHVLGGAIAGTAGGGLRPLYRAVLLAWCLTAPLAALLAALCALALAA